MLMILPAAPDRAVPGKRRHSIGVAYIQVSRQRCQPIAWPAAITYYDVSTSSQTGTITAFSGS
jgi:hypothetical protein